MRLQKDLSVDGPGPQELPVHMSKRGRTTLSRPGRRVGSHEISDLQEEPGSQEEEPALDIMAFPENIFAGILESLPPEQLLNVSRVSKQFAQVSEVALEKACRTHRWSLPRFPRGAAASTLFPWRALYRQHACIACGQSGEFVLRRKTSSHAVHLICRRCTNMQWVQQRLIRENLFVDLVGVSGKKLLSQRDLGRQGTTKGAALLRHFLSSI